MNYVLVLLMLSPGGTVLKSEALAVGTRAECMRAAREITYEPDLMGVRYRNVCIAERDWDRAQRSTKR